MKIAILISTRNRPEQLDALLNSISLLEVKPAQVVISSSGSSVSSVIDKYKHHFLVTHVHSELYGQIRQKMLGIQAIENCIQWTIFLDDDVLLPKNTLRKLNDFIQLRVRQSSSNLLGIGFRTPSTTNLKGTSKAKKILARFFLLDSKNLGDVLASGHPVSYVDSTDTISTRWLNGISAWSHNCLKNYGSDFLESRYSAYEDVFFSYGQSKLGELIFTPSIEIEFQSSLITDLSQQSVFKAASFWRLKFVLNHPELSNYKFLWSQVGRSLFFLANSKRTFSGFALGAYTTISIFIEIVFQLVIKRDANWSLNRHCKSA
jgi:glycosyltransferase involved in cell wall biosynthesis